MNEREGSGRIGVIGGGLGGLAAACTLAARGYQVVLFERSDWLGGKAAVWSEAGYRFDMGPTILTLPSVLHRIFREADRELSDYLDLIPLDPQWRCFSKTDRHWICRPTRSRCRRPSTVLRVTNAWARAISSSCVGRSD